jgi:hypothetical protein
MESALAVASSWRRPGCVSAAPKAVDFVLNSEVVWPSCISYK